MTPSIPLLPLGDPGKDQEPGGRGEGARPLFTLRPLTAADLPSALALYRLCEDFLALGPTPTASMQMVAADWELSRAQGGAFCGIYLPTGELAGILDILPAYQGDPQSLFIEL
jgi:hypothetical protein